MSSLWKQTENLMFLCLLHSRTISPYFSQLKSHESRFLGTLGGISTSTIFASGLQHLGK